MKEAFKTQLSKVLRGGVNISWPKLGLRGMAGNWIKQDILMPVFWHFINVSFCVTFSSWENEDFWSLSVIFDEG